MEARLTRLDVPDAPEAWRVLGFLVAGGRTVVGGVELRFDAPDWGWGFDPLPGEVDALRVPTVEAPPPPDAAPHPNGVDRVDHVVYAVPRLDDAVEAIGSALGLQPRRRDRPRKGGPEMAFFRAGAAVIEVVEGAEVPRLWGLALRCPDLDHLVRTAREAGGELRDPKPAVQGGRIVTARAGVHLAVMGP